MEVACEGCAGCCLDWRSLAAVPDHERRGPHTPIDDVYNLVPLTRDETRAFVDAGLGAAMTPRLWEAEEGLEIDGYTLATIGGSPVFFLGLRKPWKPVAPFGTAPSWLRSCVFLDPETLQCRIHDQELYPAECAEYPGHNLQLDVPSECERVEDAFGGQRLLDDTVPEELSVVLGPEALGWKVFCYPEPDALAGVVSRIANRELSRADRAQFIGAAAASAPGTTTVNSEIFEATREKVVSAESWVQPAIDEWAALVEDREADPGLGVQVEEERGAPSTPGWDA